MANGDIVQTNPEIRHIILIDGATATTTGTWVDIGPYTHEAGISIRGITTATVTLNGSRAATKPTDASAGTELAEHTANAEVDLPSPPRWLKAIVEAYTSGTIYVEFTGTRGGAQ